MKSSVEGGGERLPPTLWGPSDVKKREDGSKMASFALNYSSEEGN